MNEEINQDTIDESSDDKAEQTQEGSEEQVLEESESATETPSVEEVSGSVETQNIEPVGDTAGKKPAESDDDQIRLADLEKQRERLNREAEKHKRRRNQLNDQTKEWVEKRDALNAKVREIVDEASTHREARDGLNEDVKQLKTERDEWNARVNELTEKLSRVKRRNLPKGRIPLGKLKKELRSLEFRQMTSVLTPDKERDLVEAMSRIESEIKAREKELEENEEVKAAVRELRETKEKAEVLHKKVGDAADAAQLEHDKMTELYEVSDQARRDADQAQEEFIKTKMMADEEHKKHIEFIRQVHDLDKIISGIRFKHRMARVRGDEKVARREAEDIYERFKKGDKLSTEDLMTLQKSGYL